MTESSPRERVEKALEISKKATPGPWHSIALTAGPEDTVTVYDRRQDVMVADECYPRDGEHIAQMNPDFTQAVLEGWLIMEAALEECDKWADDEDQEIISTIAEAITSARAKLNLKQEG